MSPQHLDPSSLPRPSSAHADMRVPLQSLHNARYFNSHSLPLPADEDTKNSPKKQHSPQMADIMQPLGQSASMGMLSPRGSPVDAQAFPQRPSHSPRSSYNSPNHSSNGQYRSTSTPPVQPYAFQSTPQLRQEHRTISATTPQNIMSAGTSAGSSSDKSTLSSSPASSISGPRDAAAAKDESISASRPQSIIALSSSVPDLSLHNFDTSPKASPERYRRGSSKKADAAPKSPTASSAAPSGSGMAAVEHLYKPPTSPRLVTRTSSDDSAITKTTETAKRYRRRSLVDPESASTAGTLPQRPNSAHASVSPGGESIRAVGTHSRNASADSTKSTTSAASQQASRSSMQDGRRDASPVRGAAETGKRQPMPSPLSKSASPVIASPERKTQQASPSKHQSPAAQHLAALSDKDLNKGMKSRLRRAFSFGSAAELRKAALTRPHGENQMPRGGNMDDMDEEQREIVRRQEAAGIGAGIYSGQGGFSGSTDNLSISSTASSASVMLRKMGQGVRKGGRSLKGLFRPKSVIGVPAADGPIQPSLAEVSMVTVEAERNRFVLPEHTDIGSLSPKREDLDRPDSSDRKDSLRKSIVGSDMERAEVLAAVKKGILKRSAGNSPQGSPVIQVQSSPTIRAPQPMVRAQAAPWPGGPTIAIPVDIGTPSPSGNDGKPRSLSSAHGPSSNDYFSRGMITGTRSVPQTPGGSRNISFSPRIQFHDVWSSTEYDRRCEIATCNRLTPVLAQQIKEELNTFKMEMEVHELSKTHTHFF